LFLVASNNDVCSLLCTFPDSMPYRTNAGPVLEAIMHGGAMTAWKWLTDQW